MDSAYLTEQAYTDAESIGMAVIATCGMLSLISVLTMFVILGVTAVRRSRSGDETPFARTHVGMYFSSLLVCNLAQAVGALLNIPWIVEKRIYVGTLCTTQAIIQQIGSVGTAIFVLVIAAHTFSLLFLRRQWPNRTSYVALFVAWGVLVLDMCIGKFVVAKGDAYYGIADHWCWITPARPTERWTTEYLFMFTSAAFSFVLHLLVFLRLRGNISVSDGYKVQFHERPKVRVSRTTAGAYIVTDDRRVESHLTTVGKQLMWHPIAYIILVLPFAAARFSSFSGTSVPFPVTAFASAVFMLGGFVNSVLFCTTRSVLPESWRQRLSIATTSDGGRGVTSVPTRGNSIRQRDEPGPRMGVVGRDMASVVLNISMEEDVGSEYHERERSASTLKFTPSWPTRAYSGRQRAGTESYYSRSRSFSPLRNENLSLRSSGIDGDGEDSDFSSARVRPVGKVKEIIKEEPAEIAHESKWAPAPNLEDPASFHPFDITAPVNTEARRSRVPSMLTFENAVHRMYSNARLSWDSRDERNSGSGFHWLGQIRPPSQTQEIAVHSPTLVGQHPYSRPSPAPNQDIHPDVPRSIRGHQGS